MLSSVGLFDDLEVMRIVIYLIITECVFIVCGKFPRSLIKKTVRVTGLVFSVKCRYNPDEAKW